MSLLTDTIWCKGCGVEISWAPHYVNKEPYCCEDCAHGTPCQCFERMELDNDLNNPKTSTMPPE